LLRQLYGKFDLFKLSAATAAADQVLGDLPAFRRRKFVVAIGGKFLRNVTA
jgi:hypothetical protein